MKISCSQNYINSSYFSAKPVSYQKTDAMQHDSFEISKQQNSKQISFGKGLFSILFKKPERIDDSQNSDSQEPVSEYAKAISSGIKTFMDKDIPAKNLKSIMTPDEFKELLPTLNQDNFMASRRNQESGVYCVDLDYHSSFSNGQENIFDILDNVSDYANEYYAKTGKEFIFALTDRDSLDGVRHAIRIIGENPEKFKHMKLLPAIKMTYAHEAPKSKLKYENSEMLIYGINPFSTNLSNFVETTITKRKAMVVNFIKQINKLYPEFAYNVIEFAKQNTLKYKKDFTVSNLYWRAREYAETKGDTAMKGISMVPEEVMSEAEDILNGLDKIYVGSDTNAFSASGSQIIEDSELNKSIKGVFEKYSTHLDEEKGKVVSSAENLFDDMIDCLSLEPEKPVIALCAPFYLSHYYENKQATEFPHVIEFIKDLQDRSNGMLVAFESIVPSYDLDKSLSYDTVRNFNNYIKNHTELYEVGGSFAKRH